MKTWTTLVAIVVACAAGLSAQTISTTPVAAVPTTDGVVTEIIEYNNLIVIGGTFSQVGTQSRLGLAAFDKTSGALHAWNPVLTGGGISDMVLVSDVLYVAGPFNSVDSQARTQLASFDLTQMAQSGHGLTIWDPVLSNTTNVFFFGNDVQCLTYMNSTLYVGGFFGKVNGTTRGGLASFDLTNLASNDGLTSWDPNTYTNNGATGTGFEIWGVFNIVPHPASDTIVFSGPFEGVGGTHMDDGSSSPHTAVARSSFAAVSASGTGVVRTWAPSASNAAWNDDALAISGDIVYHGGPVSTSPSGLDVTATGNPFTTFIPNLDNQAYGIDVHPNGNKIFMSGSWTMAGSTSVNELLAFDTATGAIDTGWDPNPDTYATTILATAGRVYVGGAFTTISGQSRQGLAAYDIQLPAPTITTSTTLPTGTTGQNYDHQFAAQGGTQPYSWQASGLPSGWTMSTSGMLSAPNTSVVPGTFNFSVTVDDSVAQSDTGNFSVTITAPALNITSSATLPGGTAGVTYTAQLTASGGFGSYVWSSTGLPSGWSLNPSTGLINAPSGSVVAGTYNFSVQVDDQSSQMDSMAVSATIAPGGAPLAITSSGTLPNGMDGTAYNFQFTATGGQGSYTWSVTPGNLPSNWSLDPSTGVLSAAASDVVGGTYNWNVQVADSATSVSQSVSLTVDVPVLTITGGLGAGELGQTYAATLTATGGSGSGHVWTIDAGQLPPGITMNAPVGATAAGFSGTTTMEGTFGVTIRVTDDQANTTTATFSVAITAPGAGSGSSGSGDGGSSDGGGCFVSGEGTSALVLLFILAGLGVTALRRRTA